MKKSEALLLLAGTLSVRALMKEHPEVGKEGLRALLMEAARAVGEGELAAGPKARQEAFEFISATVTAEAPESVGAQKKPTAPVEKSRSLRIFTDGASRGNPGEAGIGVLIEDSSGSRLKEIRRYLGKATNNQAEYAALLTGLQASREMGAEDVSVFADSELLVKQMKGEYKVKHPLLLPLYTEAKTLTSGLKKFRITHIPRAQNAHADALANEAIDKKITS
ncbi:MAG: ribonuclease HI family protein [Nitrospirota bacterium]